jgi:hypothetical protein
MLSVRLLRIFTVVMALAMVASVPAAAKCIARCAAPAPPKCHHHSPDKQTAVHACADAVTPVPLDSPAAMGSAVSVGIAAAIDAATVPSRPSPVTPPRPAARTVLRV